MLQFLKALTGRGAARRRTGSKRRSLWLLAALSLTPALLGTPARAQSRFTDIRGNWAQPCIEQLSSQQVIAGYPDGRFRPNSPVKRAEFAAMIRKAFPFATTVRPAILFRDFSQRNWAYSAIQQAYQTGFLSGYPGRVFNPNQNISRVQVLVALTSGMNYGSGGFSSLNLKTLFDDAAQIPDYAVSAVAAAAENRLVVNYPNVGLLRPNQPATRAEVATFLCQALLGDSSPVPEEYVAQSQEEAPVNSWENSQLLRTLRVDRELYNSGYTTIEAVAISPDGTTLAISSHNYERSTGEGKTHLTLWNLQTGKMRRTLLRGTAAESFGASEQEPQNSLTGTFARAIAFSPDGQMVAAGFSDKTVKVWEVETGAEIYNLSGHLYGVHAVAFSPDGQTLASGSSDSTVKVWDLYSGRLIRTLTGHSGRVAALAFSPDSTTLASGSSDKTINLWDLGNGRLIRRLNNGGGVGSLTFAANGQRLASTCDYTCFTQSSNSGNIQGVKLWDWRTGRTISLNAGAAYQRAWVTSISPDLQTVAGYVYIQPPGGTGRNQVVLWDVSAGRPLRTIEPAAWPITFSPNGQLFVSTLTGSGVQVWR